MRANNRRDFLKAGVLFSATAVSATLAAPHVNASSQPAQQNRTGSKVRILGSGKNPIEVNYGLGQGCMGMSWNRSFVPVREKMIALIRKAYDMGVNLFDTGEASMLVQPEMERGRFPLVSNPPFRARSL